MHTTVSKSFSGIKNKKGQSLIEYLIIVALVAVGSIGVMKVLGQSLQVKFAQVAKSLGAQVEGEIENAKVTQSMYDKKDLRNFMGGSLNKESKK